MPPSRVLALGKTLSTPPQELEDRPVGAPAPAATLAELALSEDTEEVPVLCQEAVSVNSQGCFLSAELDTIAVQAQKG